MAPNDTATQKRRQFKRAGLAVWQGKQSGGPTDTCQCTHARRALFPRRDAIRRAGFTRRRAGFTRRRDAYALRVTAPDLRIVTTTNRSRRGSSIQPAQDSKLESETRSLTRSRACRGL
eukprot:4955267-Pleurochrysis_carterae.AAC.1